MMLIMAWIKKKNWNYFQFVTNKKVRKSEIHFRAKFIFIYFLSLGWQFIFFKKLPNPVILFSSLSIIFLNRTSYEKLGGGGDYIIFADWQTVFVEDPWRTMIQKLPGSLLNQAKGKGQHKKEFCLRQSSNATLIMTV